ncbi:hypothetical protein L4P92_001734 [Pseudomonas aeruginosa]|nr:hypothetical protein [Pseudomonas aeruginosa]
MTKYQFRAVMAVLWLIAAFSSPDKANFAICFMFFIGFMVALAFTNPEHMKGGGHE